MWHLMNGMKLLFLFMLLNVILKLAIQDCADLLHRLMPFFILLTVFH